MLTQLQAVFDQAMPKLLKRIAVPFTPLWCLPKPLLDRLNGCTDACCTSQACHHAACLAMHTAARSACIHCVSMTSTGVLPDAPCEGAVQVLMQIKAWLKALSILLKLQWAAGWAAAC